MTIAEVRQQLEQVFRESACVPSLAHANAGPILQQMAQHPALLTEILAQHLRNPDLTTRGHYPVLSMNIARTSSFELVANCWLPLPDGNTDLSTKAIHHHGMLHLTTVTAFGPGYEHWLFGPPERLEGERFRLRCVHRIQHDGAPIYIPAGYAHVPFYPPSLTITYALWGRLGWRALLNRPRYFDFYPDEHGFIGLKRRREFPLGPNEDYLTSLLHVLQRTGNAGLSLSVAKAHQSHRLIHELAEMIWYEEPIQPRPSPGHYADPVQNVTRQQIEHALAHQVS